MEPLNRISQEDSIETFTDKDFEKSVVDNKWTVFTETSINQFVFEVSKLIEKGKTSAITQEELDTIEKGRKDITKLVPKFIVDSMGRKRKVYVKMEEGFNYGKARESAEYKKYYNSHLGKNTSASDREKADKYAIERLKTPSSEEVNESAADNEGTEKVHKEAWERHQHNMKVQRQGKESSLKHIESKYGKAAAEHVRAKHGESVGKVVEKVSKPKEATQMELPLDTEKKSVFPIKGDKYNHKKLGVLEFEGHSIIGNDVRFKDNRGVIHVYTPREASKLEKIASKEKQSADKPLPSAEGTEGLTHEAYGKAREAGKGVEFLGKLTGKYSKKNPTETFMSAYGTKISIMGKEGDTYHVRYQDASMIIPHTEKQMKSAGYKAKASK